MQRAGAGTQRIESAFGRSLRERAVQIHQRHAWKFEGTSGRFQTRLRQEPTAQHDPAEFPISITGVTRGRSPGEFLYSLETDAISGVFAVDGEHAEQRIFHTADFRVRQIALSPEGTSLAASIVHRDSAAHIAVLAIEGTDFFEASEGDSVDIAPRWVPGARRIVFQSSGIGRDRAGRAHDFGPSTIQELNLDSGTMACLAEDPECDFLSPQKTADGTLYYIRRPHPKEEGVRPAHALMDTVLMPFRVVSGIVQFITFLAIRPTARPQEKSKPVPSRAVPAAWELVRQPAAGEPEVLARGVRAFDLTAEGSVIYTDGNAVRRLTNDGSEQILLGSWIEQIAAL